MVVLKRYMTLVRRRRGKGWYVMSLYRDDEKKFKMIVSEKADVKHDETYTKGFINKRLLLVPNVKKRIREDFKKKHPRKYQVWDRYKNG